MPQTGAASRQLASPRPSGAPGPLLHDVRFRALVGAADWARLPAAVSRRFGRRVERGAAIVYVGEIVESRRNAAGRLLAQACRLIGAPLPLHDAVAAPAVVTVTEDAATGGQLWTRIYGQARGFPQVVHSSKRFAGPTGLEEYLGCGLGIALVAWADERALHFRSDHYFLDTCGLRLRLPRWLSPGTLSIAHADRGDPWFAFILTLRHPLFGNLMDQTALFRERHAAEDARAA